LNSASKASGVITPLAVRRLRFPFQRHFTGIERFPNYLPHDQKCSPQAYLDRCIEPHVAFLLFAAVGNCHAVTSLKAEV